MMRPALLVLLLVACNGNPWRPGPTCGRAGSACAEHSDCCSFACTYGTCKCAPAGEHCLADVACCAGMVCANEQCVPGDRGDAGTTCLGQGEVCSTAADCCEGTCSGYVCQPCTNAACCGSVGGSCAMDSECCSGLVCDISGTCNGCGPAQTACNADAQCCSPRTCGFSGTCCALAGEPCQTYADCCDVQYGRCDAQHCCLGAHAVCASNAECCSGTCTASGCALTPNGSPCSLTNDCDFANGSICSGNVCCLPSAFACTVGTDCCSGVCKPNNTCQ